MRLQVNIPRDATPGTLLQLMEPSGYVVQVRVPDDGVPGKSFEIQLPGPEVKNIGMPTGIGVGLMLVDDEASAVPSVASDTYQPGPNIFYDLTNVIEATCCALVCPCCGWTTKTLRLDDEEVVFRHGNLCFSRVKRRPYSQISEADRLSTLPCCACVKFSPLGEDEKGKLRIGLGCDGEFQAGMLQEIHSRMEKCGGIKHPSHSSHPSELKKLEFAYDKVLRLASQVPLIHKKLGIVHERKVLPQGDPASFFERKEFSLSNIFQRELCCISKVLTLDNEHMVLKKSSCCRFDYSYEKRPYAELSDIEASRSCMCCHGVYSDGFGYVSPDCGCSRSKVASIASEMQERMLVHGSIGRMKRRRQLVQQMSEVNFQTSLIFEKLRMNYPPSQQVMTAVFGIKSPDLFALRAQGVGDEMYKVKHNDKKFDKKSEIKFDITNNWQSCGVYLCTCGMAGWHKKTLEFKPNELNIVEKNFLDESRIRIGYEQLTVDYEKRCYCCYSIGWARPGWGCFNAQLVDQVSRELHARKSTRSFSEMKQLESTAHEMGCKADILMNKYGIRYPPKKEAAEKAFGATRPRILSSELSTTRPHIVSEPKWEHKRYDITDRLSSCCCFLICPCVGWTTKTMDLEAEEQLIVTENWCCRWNERTPYAKLAAVHTEPLCCCCVELPGVVRSGCAAPANGDRCYYSGPFHRVGFVEEVAAELRNRKASQGNLAQQKVTDNLTNEILKLSVKMDLLLSHHDIQFPPPQETMAEIFGVDIVAGAAEESHAATPRAKAPTSEAAAHVKGNLGQAYRYVKSYIPLDLLHRKRWFKDPHRPGWGEWMKRQVMV
eukprot:gnl/TRDRNA2_/TRDRNA2_162797_c1_seq1.p1 gnl/TRDRNA2_/TRDRNA2_162797_c1~~gnl/TRDRNA2_/TRDRNA2_162797_c1_seq1.p1  ORF type:complete len:829 (-),score=139.90 gnl/TRDRNA2_/TRDRNA2_162797_c1_seq1:212-2698(-)